MIVLDNSLESKLVRLIEILEQASEAKWQDYFQEALKMLRSGRENSCKSHILGAYGGMGSFSDVHWNEINEATFDEVQVLKQDLFELSKC